MRVSGSKVIIAVFALLAFGGQSLAAVNLPCAAMGDHVAPANMVAGADHSGMNHTAMADSEMHHGAMDHNAMDHKAMDHKAMHHGAMDHSAMDHSAMGSSALDAQGAAGENCCEHGQCSMADCLSPGFAAVDAQSNPAVHLARVPAAEYAQSYSAADLAELYHPPLSR
jgi:uncharacterized protein involved in copper resistance